MSFIDDINIYNDPIIFSKRKGSVDSPYLNITETLTVDSNGMVLLTELPNTKQRVQVKNGENILIECEFGTTLSASSYSVDYPNGIVHFESSLINQPLTFIYLGEGARFYPSSRIWVQNDPTHFQNAKDKFSDIDRLITEQKSRVDTLITSNPQPSEVVDMRVDRNGTVYTVARDRINAEQAKIEAAYVDLNNHTYTSLKDRIDAEQKKIEDAYISSDGTTFTSLKDRLDNVDTTLSNLTQNIQSTSDSLTLKVNGTDFTGENIVSMIQLTPSNIKISASKIDLLGSVGVNALDTNLYSQINGAAAQSSLHLTGSLPTSIVMDTNGITAYTSDTTKFARLNDQGLYIKGGAINIDGGLPDTQIANASKWNTQGTHIDANGIYTGTVSANNVQTGKLSATNGTFWIDLDTSAANFAYQGRTVSTITQAHASDGRDITYLALEPNLTDSSMIALGKRNADGSVTNSLFVTGEYGDVYMDAPTTYIRGNLQVGKTLFGNDITFGAGGRFVTDIAGTSWSITNSGGDVNGAGPTFKPNTSGNGNVGTQAQTFNAMWANSYLGSSSLEVKTIVGELDIAQATELVQNLGIYQYYYNTETNNPDNYKIGLIYEYVRENQYGDLITNSIDKGINIYSMVSAVWATCQGLLNTVNKLGILTGDGVPSTIPTDIGKQYIDTTNAKVYVATGTTATTDWQLMN